MKRIILVLGLAAIQASLSVAAFECTSTSGGKVIVDGVIYDMPDVITCDGGGDFGGGWGGGGGPPAGHQCGMLLLSKPAGCDSPKPVIGVDYGADNYVWGSGLDTAIRNAAGSVLSNGARTQLTSTLAQHTVDLAVLANPLEQSNRRLLDGVGAACQLQAGHDAAHPPMSAHGGGVSQALGACLGTLSRLSGEANLSFSSYFQGWLAQAGIVLADLGIPQTIINWFAPENSLTKKFELATAQSQCNIWFEEVRQNGC